MFRWLRQSVEPESEETAVLNHGLFLAMEWGENFLQPIQPRLAVQYPQLNARQLDDTNGIAKRQCALAGI